LLGAREIDHPPRPCAEHPRDLVRRLWKREAEIAGHIEYPPQTDQIGPRRAEAMHQHDQRSIASTLAILPTRQPNRDARKSFFPHVPRV